MHCSVTSAAAESLELTVAGRTTSPQPMPQLTVVQALAKGDRGELAVEMLTEVGADVIVPWQAARSVVRWDGARGERALERWRATAREAAKQSRRAWWPEVRDLATTGQVAGLLSAAGCPVVLHEDADGRLTDLRPTGDVVVVVGPEGGLAGQELAALAAPTYKLGESVLRTSTAGPAAVAVLSTLAGRW